MGKNGKWGSYHFQITLLHVHVHSSTSAGLLYTTNASTFGGVLIFVFCVLSSSPVKAEQTKHNAHLGQLQGGMINFCFP